MDFRLAVMHDLPQIKMVYKKIIQNMNDNQIQIWDDIYPCEFFEEDIKNNRLYLLLDNDIVVSAFALSDTHKKEKSLKWNQEFTKVLYLDRLGVNVNYLKKGIGSLMLAKAKKVAKDLGAECLRFLVVDINKPALNLYTKNNIKRVSGIFNEVLDNDIVLHEFGYELIL